MTAASLKSAPAPFATDDDRWQAVVRRDPAADGAFWQSVRTTGIYCRPTCPARLPRRENVRFHNSVAEARRAGFRPCRRCRPDEASLAQRRAALVEQACRAIEAADEPPGLDALAGAAGVSRHHFHRLFKAHTGVTPKAYAAAHRARRVREELAQHETVTAAIYAAGFGSNGRFYATAPAQLGMTPTALRAGGDGTTIRFAVGASTLGAVLVAASDRGVCAIMLGDDPDALARDLQDRFPKAQLIAGDADFDRWVAAGVGLVERPALGTDLPLDIRGTAFQVRVWEALRQVPAGATTTYAELARRIGQPSASRAVGSACAANPIAVAVPCHRVVRTDESLAGYRWGVQRKAELLRRERAV